MLKPILAAAIAAAFISSAAQAEDPYPCLSENPPADCPTPEEAAELHKSLKEANDALEAYQKAWESKYNWAYYECENEAGDMTLEIFQSPWAGVRSTGQKIKPVEYLEDGPMKIYFYVDEETKERTGTYLMMMPDGFTGLILRGTKDVATGWICEEAEWPEAE